MAGKKKKGFIVLWEQVGKLGQISVFKDKFFKAEEVDLAGEC